MREQTTEPENPLIIFAYCVAAVLQQVKITKEIPSSGGALCNKCTSLYNIIQHTACHWNVLMNNIINMEDESTMMYDICQNLSLKTTALITMHRQIFCDGIHCEINQTPATIASKSHNMR